MDFIFFRGSLWVADSPLDNQRGSVSENIVERYSLNGTRLATVSVPGPVGLASGFGSIWAIGSAENSLYRIDPDTNSVTEQIRFAQTPVGLATTPQFVWVLGAGAGGEGASVDEVSPVTDQIVAQTQFHAGGPGAIVSVGNMVCVVLQAVKPGMSQLVELDMNSDAVHEVIIPGNRALSFGTEVLWLGASDGRLQELDLVSWRVTGVATTGTDIASVAADGNSVWVLGGGSLQRWTPADPTL